MLFQIEQLDFDELCAFMRFQAEDAFPSLKDEGRLLSFATKLHAHAEFCVCRDDRELVGLIAFYANGQGADFAYIPLVYVSPDYRKKGLFSRMLSIVEKHVKERSFSEIRVEVLKNNDNAIKCYLNDGFEVVEDHGNKWLLRLSLFHKYACVEVVD